MKSLGAIRESKAIRWMVLLLAGIIMNLSIDPPDREAPGVAEDLTFNDVESIAELVGEQFLGLTDLFPESDEPDGGTDLAKKALEYRCTRYAALLNEPGKERMVVMSYPYAEHFTVQYKPEPRVPPPWA
jgi:hypothetical protein